MPALSRIVRVVINEFHRPLPDSFVREHRTFLFTFFLIFILVSLPRRRSRRSTSEKRRNRNNTVTGEQKENRIGVWAISFGKHPPRGCRRLPQPVNDPGPLLLSRAVCTSCLPNVWLFSAPVYYCRREERLRSFHADRGKKKRKSVSSFVQ